MGSGSSRLRAVFLAAILASGVVPQATFAQGPGPPPAPLNEVEQQRQMLENRLAELKKRQAAAPTEQGAQLIKQVETQLAQLPPKGGEPTPADVVKAQELFKSGPSTPRPGLSSTFSIQGFIREGWPVVMDFEPQPNTRTELTVLLLTPQRVVLFNQPASILLPIPQGSRVVDSDGSRGRQVLRLFQGPLVGPGASGDHPVQIAEYGLVSYQLVDGQIAKDAHGRRIQAPVAVYGFGAGPRAAGSVTINKVQLTPATLTKPGAAAYSYFAEKAFDQANADIWLSCKQVFCSHAHPVGPVIHHLASSGWVSGTWSVPSSARAGSYQLFVRAWLHCNGADVANNYKNCGDEAAWATGYSRLLTLQ